MSDNDEYIKFKSADELKVWLVNVKLVDADVLGDAANTLFNRGFLTSSSLMGITADELKAEKLSTPVVRELSNKLEKKPQQDLLLNVLEDVVTELKEFKTQQQQIGQHTRATPIDSAATVGRTIYMELTQSKNIRKLDKQPFDKSEPAVLDVDKLKALKALGTEQQVVAFMTPVFEELLAEDSTIEVVNSEEYAWLETKSLGYKQKPDMLFCHSAIYSQRKPPGTNTPNKFKYGILADWGLHDCIDVVVEAKKKIDNTAFGEVINYARHICYVPPSTDKDKFWLIRATRGIIMSVEECTWTLPGSRKTLQSFMQDGRSPWVKLLIAACKHWDLQVQSDAFLGKGAFGRVFKVSLNQQGHMMFKALKIVVHDDRDAAMLDLLAERDCLTKAAKLLPACVAKVDAIHDFGDLGAAMLLADVGSKVPRDAWHLLFRNLGCLHEKNIMHGDPRPSNAIYVNNSVKWIDFLGSLFGPENRDTFGIKLYDLKLLIETCCFEMGCGANDAKHVSEELVKGYTGTPESAVAIYQAMLCHQIFSRQG